MRNLPRYDIQKSYQWNYAQTPDCIEVDEPPIAGEWHFAGSTIASPLGVAAGPLLNGKWCLYYARLGFDVVTYKTVRSNQRACYPLPNLQPVTCQQLTGGEQGLSASEQITDSWAVSFGMPSTQPTTWQEDIRGTKRSLPPQKKLNVSVVGSIQEGWSLQQLADDYAHCARLASDAGADSVETNFSCPNVATCDGQLFQHAADAQQVAEHVRNSIGDTPLLVKIGHLPDPAQLYRLIDALTPSADALVMTNSVAATVTSLNGKPLFDGHPRGICGAAIRDASTRQVELAVDYIAKRNGQLEVIGVGGISTAQHAKRYLNAGATSVQLATAVMLDPEVGLNIRQQWST